MIETEVTRLSTLEDILNIHDHDGDDESTVLTLQIETNGKYCKAKAMKVNDETGHIHKVSKTGKIQTRQKNQKSVTTMRHNNNKHDGGIKKIDDNSRIKAEQQKHSAMMTDHKNNNYEGISNQSYYSLQKL